MRTAGAVGAAPTAVAGAALVGAAGCVAAAAARFCSCALAASAARCACTRACCAFSASCLRLAIPAAAALSSACRFAFLSAASLITAHRFLHSPHHGYCSETRCCSLGFTHSVCTISLRVLSSGVLRCPHVRRVWEQQYWYSQSATVLLLQCPLSGMLPSACQYSLLRGLLGESTIVGVLQVDSRS